MTIVMISLSSHATILVHWFVSKARFMFGGWARPIAFRLGACDSPDEPKIMSRMSGELYCTRFIGHVRGEE